ncbi:MAG: SRPBCC domain-containing protein [Thermoplasmata archaeon]
MQVQGQFQVRAQAAQVFAFLSDVRQLLECLDDPHTVDSVQGDQFAGTITTGVAFIHGTFRFSGQYTEKTPGQHIKTQIRGTGMGNAVDATLAADLTAAGGGTAVAWNADIRLTGTAASLAEALIRSTIQKKATALFEKVRQKLEAAPVTA